MHTITLLSFVISVVVIHWWHRLKLFLLHGIMNPLSPSLLFCCVCVLALYLSCFICFLCPAAQIKRIQAALPSHVLPTMLWTLCLLSATTPSCCVCDPSTWTCWPSGDTVLPSVPHSSTLKRSRGRRDCFAGPDCMSSHSIQSRRRTLSPSTWNPKHADHTLQLRSHPSSREIKRFFNF